MRLIHKIGVAFVDKLILAFALIIVGLSVVPQEEVESYLMIDAVTILLIVFASYLITIIAVNILTLGVRTGDKWQSLFVGVLASGFVLFLFPKLLWFLLLIFGQRVSADVETVLLWTVVIRTFLRFYLKRLWGEDE